jgi:two-component system, OmpR family, sensor histidine kinase BaeS
MARARGPWIGKLGLRLALAFVAVALAAVMSSALIGAVTTSRDVGQMVRGQHSYLTRAVAMAAGRAYHSGWQPASLMPLADLVAHAGAAVRVTDLTGQQIRASHDFASYGSRTQLTDPVMVRRQQVGWVTVRFDDTGLGGPVERFQDQRWPARFLAGGVAVLFALLVALVVSRRITAPVDRLIDAARARGRGEMAARVSGVRGFSEIRELAEAFDQMAAVREEQDQVRRNLVADVAHELRTPIAILQAGHEAMIDGLATPSADHVVSLHDEVLRLARMVDDLQRLASAEAAALQLTLVPCDLAAAAGVAADSLAESFDAAGITLRRHLSAVVVLGDPLRMHEIATNLLTNAVKFTPAGGSVLLETGPDQGQAGGLAMLRVSDTGVGIPSDELPLVSERFFRGQRSAGIAGSGIGLTIVTELVRGHHGRVEVTSAPDAGTVVTVRLPAVPGRAAAGPAYGRPVSAGPVSAGPVSVLDDS